MMLSFSTRQVALSASLLLLLVSTAFARSSSPADDWLVLSPAEEGFSVKMPVKPDMETQWIPLLGNNYRLRLYTGVDTPTGLLYMVVMQEFPSVVAVLEPVKRLDKFMGGFKTGLGESLASAVGGKFDLVIDHDLTLDGNVGRQYKLTVGESRGMVRAFDRGRRVYLLMVVGADEKNASVVRFFDSFEFKPAPEPVPQAVGETKTF
jgi:hypothetical protein